jgi:hypothetical protein
MNTSKNSEFGHVAALRYLAPILSYGKLVLRPAMLAERRQNAEDGKPVCRAPQ